MKFVTAFTIVFALNIISCDSGKVEIAPRNTPHQISTDERPIADNTPNRTSPKEILHKTVATYAANPFLLGSARFEKWFTNEYDTGDSHKRDEFRFVYNMKGDKTLDLASNGDRSFFQRMSVKDNFAVSDYSDRRDFDGVDAGMKAFQKIAESEFLLGEILFQDEERFLLSEKMGLILEGDDTVNGVECFVIRLEPTPGSGMKRKVWISKDGFLIRKYYTESCSANNSCLYKLEEYDYWES